MDASLFDYWGAFVGLAVIVGVVVTILSYRLQRRGGSARISQRMTDAEDSTQTATQPGTEQQMTRTRRGRQDG
mgnify:CR=1 FL=1